MVGNERHDRAATAAIFARTSHGFGDALHENLRSHDALDNAARTVSLNDVEHLAVKPEGRGFIHERGDIKIAERHNATPPKATRQRGIAPQAGALSKLLILSNVPALTIGRLRAFKKVYFALLRAASLITLGVLIGIGIEAVSAAKQVTAAFHQFAIEHRTPPER